MGFNIKLESNLSTGYRWFPDFNPRFLKLIGINYSHEDLNESSIVGELELKNLYLKPLKVVKQI